MISLCEFIKQSLGLHLFFARIMKEHSLFLELGFTPRDTGFTKQADAFRREFDRILGEAIKLSEDVINPEVLKSGEVVTPFTLNAEKATAFFTGIQIPTQLTRAEEELTGNGMTRENSRLEQRVSTLNQGAISATASLIKFKSNILREVLSCKMFTLNYPLLIEHIIREAKLYLQMLNRLQSREEINLEREAFDLQFFWNRQMAEHAKFIRGLLDPTEDDLINQADMFGDEFDQLTAAAKTAIDTTAPVSRITEESLKATKALRSFKEQGTQGILDCKVKSIIVPLLGDHVLREANHYLRLLKIFRRS